MYKAFRGKMHGTERMAQVKKLIEPIRHFADAIYGRF